MRAVAASGDPFEAIYGYSRAIRVGDHVHVSGTSAQPPFIEGCDSYIQAKNALKIIEKALEDVGANLAAVVRTVAYVTDIADIPLVARAHLEAFEKIRPASTIVEVSALDDPARTVEIEAYAICSSPQEDSA
ncbi:MAG: Rid family hydrolase [Terrimesophilobacter sp.]